MAAPELVNMLAGDSSYADVLERFWAAEAAGGTVENPGTYVSHSTSTINAINKALHAAGRKYYETQGDAIRAVEDALMKGAIRWDASNHHWDHVAYETDKRYGPFDVGHNLWLNFVLYRMPSGRYELTGVVMKGGTRGVSKQNPKGDVGDYASKAMMDKYKIRLLRGGRVDFPIGRDAVLRAFSYQPKYDSVRGGVSSLRPNLRIVVVGLDTGEDVSDGFILGPLSTRTVNMVGHYVHDLIDAFGYSPEDLNKGLDHARNFINDVLHRRFNEHPKARRGRVPNPSGRDFMLSYLPANSGSFKTIPYASFNDALGGMQARVGPSTLKMEVRDMRTTPSTPVMRWDASHGLQRLNPDNPFSDRGRKTGDIEDAIHVGDKVVVTNRFGQERTGRAVMRGPHGWVLNMGGAHGTPQVATNENIVKVIRKGTRPDRLEHHIEGEENPSAYGRGPAHGMINIHSTYDRLDAEALSEHLKEDHAILNEVASGQSRVRPGHKFWYVLVNARDRERAVDVRNDWLDEKKHRGEVENPRDRNANARAYGKMDAFTKAYVQSALWTEQLDTNHSVHDIDTDTLQRMVQDCESFLRNAGEDLSDDGQSGRDFWLTRNGHGAGFWDGDWPEPQATKLTELSKRFGEYDLYVGDDGLIYGSGGRKVNPAHSGNPSTAADMFETFHGTPSTETLEVTDTFQYHDDLATLGDAIEMVVKLARPHRGTIKIGFDGKTKIACNPSGTQLYVVDGDQSLNLSTMGFKGARKGKHGTYTDEKDKVMVGEIVELTYRAKKGFDNFKLTDYYHGLGEDSGVRPSLVYDALNKQMEIVGGQYKVLDVGVVN